MQMCACACLCVRANYLSMFRFGGQNRVLPRIRRDRYRAIGELRRRVSHLRIPQKSPVSGQFAAGCALYSEYYSDRIRERTFSTSTLATVELTPWCMYRCIHTSEIRHFRGSRGRPSRNAIPLANTARGWVSVLLISSPNYFEFPLTAWERLPSI